ncbi:MAG: GTP cyclohydrolase I, partial [Dehalococcoidia bacterium]
LRDIRFYSMCEHHLIPFFGTAHIAYLPNGRVVGVSKIVRALEVLTHRPQLQERLTAQFADTLITALQADGVAVVLKAEHLCMSMRGVQKPGTFVVTSAIRGDFRKDSLERKDILAILGGS